jgi:hypothetical protein
MTTVNKDLWSRHKNEDVAAANAREEVSRAAGGTYGLLDKHSFGFL